jgi:hypothetical protein
VKQYKLVYHLRVIGLLTLRLPMAWQEYSFLFTLLLRIWPAKPI